MRPLVAAALLIAACGSSSEAETVTVFAASSLGPVFEELAVSFEEQHPGVDVVLNLAGSQTLATQIENGARPDLLATADEEQMERAAAVLRPLAGPSLLAANRLAIVVESGNPHRIATLADLQGEDVVVVLAAEAVPLGSYSRQVLARAGVDLEPASLETNAGLVLSKVVLGEADAGIVYLSDARRAEEAVSFVGIPDDLNVTATYPVAVFSDGAAADEVAVSFYQFLASPHATRILAGWGFER